MSAVWNRVGDPQNRSRAIGLLLAGAGITLASGWAAHAWPRGELFVDNAVLRFTDAIQVDWIESTLRSVGRLGGTEVVGPLGMAIALVLTILMRSTRPALNVLVSWCTAAALCAIGKHLLERPEPHDRVGELGLSFPSGHVAQSIAMYGGLALVTWLFFPRKERVARALAGVACAIVTIASLYRATHWLTDIIGAVGVAMVGLALMVLVDPLIASLERRARDRWQPRVPAV